MKLAISAALLSIAVSAPFAAPIAAQSASDAPPAPPPFGRHGGGPHHPGGRGMFAHGMAAHRVETIPGSPFIAQFTESATFTVRQGSQQQRSSTAMVYRDSQGRVRQEVTLPPPPPRPPASDASGSTAPAAPREPRTIVTIVDPVAHTMTYLDPQRRTAMVHIVPADFFSHMQQREDRAASGEPSQHMRNQATTTSLGTQVFAGVSATGEQTTAAFPSREGGTAHTMTRQTWFSPDLKLEVSSTETGDRGTRSDTLSTLSRTEPDPGLFQVPAGYTLTTAPDHAWHHRGGPGGYGSPDGAGGPDGPPPPLQ